MLLASLAVQCSALVLPASNLPSSFRVAAAGAHRHPAVTMMPYNYAKQYAKQQAAMKEARMRAEERKEGLKPKAGFSGGIKEAARPSNIDEDGKPKALRYDERITSSWESSDTPEFMPEEGTPEYEKFKDLMDIPFTEGMRGSQHDGEDLAELNHSSDPEMDIYTDPTLVYIPEMDPHDAQWQLEMNAARDFVLPEPKFNVNTMTETQFDAEFEIFANPGDVAKLVIEVKPVAMAFEDFYCGFTADSHPAFEVTQNACGKMERRNGPPTPVEVTVDPNGAKGDLIGYLCFIQPEERAYNTFYKITCAAR